VKENSIPSTRTYTTIALELHTENDESPRESSRSIEAEVSRSAAVGGETHIHIYKI